MLLCWVRTKDASALRNVQDLHLTRATKPRLFKAHRFHTRCSTKWMQSSIVTRMKQILTKVSCNQMAKPVVSVDH